MKRLIIVSLILIAGSAAEAQRSATADAIFREATKCLHEIESQTELNYAVSELAEAQARAGFLADAIATTAYSSNDPDVVLVNIARIETLRGRYDSAIAVVAGHKRYTQDLVRLEIGVEQARRGDVKAAQQTAASMLDGYYSETVLYFVSLELQRQGKTDQAQSIASTFKYSDHALPTIKKYDWRLAAPPPVVGDSKQTKNFYSSAVAELTAGMLQKAIASIEADPNPADVSANFAHLAREAAELGNLDATLKLAAKVRVTGAEYEDAYLMETLGPIGKLWGTKDADAAVKWATNRPTPSQRVLALAGVAEGTASSAGAAKR